MPGPQQGPDGRIQRRRIRLGYYAAGTGHRAPPAGHSAAQVLHARSSQLAHVISFLTRCEAFIQELHTEVGRDLHAVTYRSCRTQLGLDADGDANQRLAAFFVVAITLGLRPGERRKLTWGLVDLNRGVVHVWRSASKSGHTKTPQSKRSLVLPRRAITALKAHQNVQDRGRGAAGRSWRGTKLVFCHEHGSITSADALNWRFGRPRHRDRLPARHQAHDQLHCCTAVVSLDFLGFGRLNGP
jgi:hypothetical protein